MVHPSSLASEGGRPGAILVAIGRDDGYEASLGFACAAAMRSGHTIGLVHVVPDSRTAPGDELLRQAAGHVHGLTGGTIPVETSTPVGEVVPVLLELSRDVEMVVLQRRQLSRLERMITGSISAEVAGRASAQTVSVPADWQPTERPDRCVVVGVDAPSEDGDLLRLAFARAASIGAEVSIVHGWHMESALDDAIVDQLAVEKWQATYLNALTTQLAPVSAENPHIRSRVQVVHTSPAEALVLASRNSELVVIGRGGLALPLIGHLGPVARAVMRDAECPVEVMHA